MTKILHSFSYPGFLSLDLYESQDRTGRWRPILTPLYHFHSLSEHMDINRSITENSLSVLIVTGFESGTFGFLVQVANY